MSVEEARAADAMAASIWHVDRSACVTQLVSGDPSAPRALVLVRDHGRNSGFVEIDGTDHPEEDPRVAAVPPASARGWEEGAGADIDATVIMCTVGSSDMLEEAVRAILDQDHQRFTLVVVDNAPHMGLTREKLAGIDDTRLSIVSASRPGLSRARNRGVLAARGEVIVFTDDDAIVDSHWLTAMIDPFTASPYVAATTGIVLPLQQRYAPQRWFESRGGFPKDMTPRVWCAGDVPEGLDALGEKGNGGPLFPITTARVGAGVCMAMRRDVLMEVGPFDPALGAGTSTRGGEDLDMFARILATGDVIIHTPDALVHHRHRVDEAGLDKQIRGNGSGMAALLTKAVLAKPTLIGTLVARIPSVLSRIKPGSARVAGTESDVPGSLTASEIRGFLEGPFLYLSSHRRNKLSVPRRGGRDDAQRSARPAASEAVQEPATLVQEPATLVSSQETNAPEGNTNA